MRNYTLSALVFACLAFAPNAGSAQPAATGKQEDGAQFDRLCADRTDPARQIKFAEKLVERLKLTQAQTAAFTDFQNARAKSISDAKAKLCANKPDLSSFEARLVFGQNFLEGRLAAVKEENPKLIAFYNSLDAQQKTMFDEIRSNMAQHNQGRRRHHRHHHHHHTYR